MNGHAVILNWTDAALDLVQTMHPMFERQNNSQIDRHDVVVVSRDPVVFPHEGCFTSTYLMIGDPADEAMMSKAAIEDAKTVILLADRSYADPDNQTLMLALAVNKYLKSKGRPTIIHHDLAGSNEAGECNPGAAVVRIVAEVLDPVNATAFRRTSLTGIHEIICEDDLGLRILAQATKSSGVARVLGDLLDRSSDSSEIYQVPVPERLIGEKFDSMRALYDLVYGDFERKQGDASIPVLVGLARFVCGLPIFIINPLNSYFRKPEAIKEIRDGDKLLVVCKGDCDADLFFNDLAFNQAPSFERAAGNDLGQ